MTAISSTSFNSTDRELPVLPTEPADRRLRSKPAPDLAEYPVSPSPVLRHPPERHNQPNMTLIDEPTEPACMYLRELRGEVCTDSRELLIGAADLSLAHSPLYG